MKENTKLRANEQFLAVLTPAFLLIIRVTRQPTGIVMLLTFNERSSCPLSGWKVLNFKVVSQEAFSHRSTGTLGTIVVSSAKIWIVCISVWCISLSASQFSQKRDQNIPTWNLILFYFLSDAHKVLHIKSGACFHPLACLVKRYQTQEILSTFTRKGRKLLATYPSLYKRGLFLRRNC